MTPERWEQITEIYQSAQELDSVERSDFLERACAGDEFLRREVESLLAADAEARSFIARPALSDVAGLLTTEDTPTLIGRNLGHYRVISRIGAGGMGEIYLAEDSKLGRLVALKTLPNEFCGNPNFLQRFRIEARAAATLNHPCIATLYSVEELDDCYFITLEYVKGVNLAEIISEGETDLEISLDWFLCLADALAHSHEQGVIHRDIKPGNVMIKSDGVPKILDFGLAQIDLGKNARSASTLRLTQTGQIFGTPSYMSPEQAEGEAVDHRSDVFSFGVLMYETVTGERPFKGNSYASIVSELLKSEPPPVARLKPETPVALTRLIERCLRKSRRERPQSMREVCAVLEEIKAAIEAGVSPSDSSKSASPQPKSFSSRRIFAPLVLLAAVAAFAIYYFVRQSPPPVINFDDMTLRKLSQTNNVAFAHVTPDGKSVVYHTIDESDRRALWIRRVEDKNALQLIAPQPNLFWGGYAVSPDGAQIFYIVAEPDARHGALHRISSLGGAPRKLNDAANDVGAVSPDGSRILFVRYGERGQIVSANASDGGDERVIRTGEPNSIFRDPRFSPDGGTVFYSKLERREGEEFWSLVEIPVGGGEEETILSPRKERIGELAVLKNGGGLLINKTDAVSNLQQIFHVSLPGGELQRVTNDLNSYFGVSASDDGGKIVTAQRHASNDIWIAAGGNMEKITTESNVYDTAVFTPDGRIVYDATDNNRPHIWIMNHDGTNAQQLTPNDSSDFEPRVSPDGRFIVFTSDRTGERKVWRMNIDGSSPQLLTAVGGVTSGAVIAPGAPENVLFTWARNDRTVLGRISLFGGAIAEQPLFSKSLWSLAPDGKQVAYVFYDEPSREYKVRVRPLETDEPSTVFDISPTRFLSWTADGKGLLYREIEPSRESNSTVRLQSLSGGEPKAFLRVNSDTVSNVSQSGDGKKTAIVRGKIVTDAVLLTRINQN